MPVDTANAFVSALRNTRLLTPEQLDEVGRQETARPQELAKDLVQRGWLTNYQAKKVLQGRDPNLGEYTLLDKLGEGAMGKVYKARHRSSGQVVALKVIRAEKLSNDSSVRRFFREVEAVANLNHPNIVRAFEKGESAEGRYYAMEYVDGTSLAWLIKQSGPLPVSQACDYILQAALGLQHAHEHGLVHRDIKPENFLISTAGEIKLLDLGLARLNEPEPGQASSSLTKAGQIVGTPDFIAPEQARNSHTVDIRADLYSLGCTFYYLLTGKVPFPGGSPMEKLVKHHSEEPKPVEQQRADVPAGVSAVLRKLMAKKPADRYQTPIEVAEALRPFAPERSPLPAAAMRKTPTDSTPQVETMTGTTPQVATMTGSKPSIGEPVGDRRGWIVVAIAVAAFVVTVAGSWVVMNFIR